MLTGLNPDLLYRCDRRQVKNHINVITRRRHNIVTHTNVIANHFNPSFLNANIRSSCSKLLPVDVGFKLISSSSTGIALGSSGVLAISADVCPF